MGTNATLVIDFGSDESIFLAAELDAERNGDKTTFQPGDDIYFRVYHTNGIPYETSPSVGPGLRYEIIPSSGSVTNILEGEPESVTAERLTFVQTKTANTSKYIHENNSLYPVSYTWYDAGSNGKNYGAITRAGDNQVSAALADADSVGIASISYTTKYDLFKVNTPVDATAKYGIVILIKVVED